MYKGKTLGFDFTFNGGPNTHIFGVICHLEKQILIWFPLYFLMFATFKVVQIQCLANFYRQKFEFWSI